jgi:hypothetical protein
MNTGFDIKQLPNTQIDKTKWDQCIEMAGNGLIYARSYYLDKMAENWDALVMGDYDIVMPLTWKKKFGIRYLYQPFLTAQLGVFGNGLTEKIITRFLQSIPSSYRLVEIFLNESNNTRFPGTTPRTNFILDLDTNYELIAAGYNENTKRNLKKGQGCVIGKNIDEERIISLALQQMKNYGNDEQANVSRFRSLYPILKTKGEVINYGVTLEAKLLAAAIFLRDQNRSYYILVGNHPDGKNLGASHLLIDGFIRDHAGQTLLLDFEGSDVPGLASFYKGFGAQKTVYPFLKINRLPFFLKWLKK